MLSDDSIFSDTEPPVARKLRSGEDSGDAALKLHVRTQKAALRSISVVILVFLFTCCSDVEVRLRDHDPGCDPSGMWLRLELLRVPVAQFGVPGDSSSAAPC
ncbi:hypothetical protein L596_007319 [Steinernema carpocapsae]|uniref:Uncharacterized protein n=1 Tax=Steinernema carpocapsae TaxID=34508 RepID=A0A4U5P8X2_STECR|nr:hypothetical protein L596_007319 [Steinernema carpocapsae]